MQAAEICRRAAALKPGFAKAYANLGHAVHACSDAQGAPEAYSKALALQPLYPEVLSAQGLVRRELGHITDSIAALERALEQRADYPEAMYNLGLP